MILSLICLSLFFVGGNIRNVYAQSNNVSSFNRNLTVGLSGADVQRLQTILNQDIETQIAYSGPGSPGNETMYFGVKTAQAVIKFQEKYREEILTPAGLYHGTGYVGSATRVKLESLLSGSLPRGSSSAVNVNKNTSTTSPELINSVLRGVLPQQIAFVVASANDIAIFGLSHTKIKPGDWLTITGFGLDQGTVVHIGDANSVVAATTSNDLINIQIPNIPYGTYQVWVSNTRGSTKDSGKYYVIIGNETDSRPKILSVTPTEAKKGDDITIILDKADLSGNKIYSSLGIISSVSSTDGRTLRVNTNNFSNAGLFFSNNQVNRFLVTFGVGTRSGQSLNYGYFYINK